MTRYGSHTTFDAPTEKKDEAFKFLKEKFGNIGGIVRKVSNPHDLGSYLSFEIDYPEGMVTDLEEEHEDYSWFVIEAEKIQKEYDQKFQDYL